MNEELGRGDINGGVGITFPICTATFAVLLVLKLAHIIDIGWLWVFSPLWIPLAIGFGILIVLAVIAGFLALVAWIADKVG